MSSGNSRFKPKTKKRCCDYCGGRQVVRIMAWELTDKFYAMIGESPPAKKGMITEAFCEGCLLLYGPKAKPKRGMWS